MAKVCRPKGHWGPYLWGFIHTITAVDYQNNVEYNQRVIQNLQGIYKVFPCPKCKDLYKTHLDKLAFLDLREPMVLFYWSVDLHNAVNLKLGKPMLSYDRAVDIWCNKMQ